jgi:hypothetical protein
VERVFRLRQDRAVIDAEAFRSMSPDDHQRGFVTALAVLVAEFNAYLERDNASPADDLVGYRQHAIWLSHDELTALIGELRKAILPVLANPARGDRARYLLSPILFPIEDPPAEDP